MLKKRVIPILQLNNDELVKSIKYKNHKYVGDPINAVRIFNEIQVDEIILLDVFQSKNNLDLNYEIIKDIADECRMPFTYGGGIKNIDQVDINNANQLGYKIKLMGIAEINNNKILQRVHPALIKNNSYISKINGVLNAVIVESNPVGQSVLQGEGAGPGPTTSSLISDLCSVLRGNIKFPFVVSEKKRKLALFDSIDNKNFPAYFRLDVKDKHGILSDIANVMAKNKVSIKRLIQNPTKDKKIASIVIITHRGKSSSFVKVLNLLKLKKYTANNPKFIRIEEF